MERWCHQDVLRTLPTDGMGGPLIHWTTAAPVPLPLRRPPRAVLHTQRTYVIHCLPALWGHSRIEPRKGSCLVPGHHTSSGRLSRG